MRILVAGGTSFVGRAIAWAAVNAGHQVTVINRGITPSDLPQSVTRLIGDRGGDLSALSGLSFDATVDTTAYRPRNVEVLATALGDRGGHHLQISSVSAYADPPSEGATELTAQLWDEGLFDHDSPITNESYGPLKAACERSAHQYFGKQLTIVRPTYVIGSHDATLRFPYWVQRALRGGRIAVPGPHSSAMQYIDARDLGEFVVTLLSNRTTGEFHAAQPFPAPRFVEFIESVATHLGPAGTEVVGVSPERVIELDLESKFPLWTGTPTETALAMNPAAALAAGLRYRTLHETIDDVVSWWGDKPWPPTWLTAEEETRLLPSP